MSDIDTVRVIIQDTALYQVDFINVDGTQKAIQTQYYPLVRASVIITGDGALDVASIDEYNGVVTFTSAPSRQTLTVQYNHVNLLDADLQAFMTLETSANGTLDLRLAAADALDSIARSQALIQKKIKILDLETDGPALAKELRASADSLRKQVLQKDMQESTFDIIEQIELGDNAAFREKIVKDWLRDSS